MKKFKLITFFTLLLAIFGLGFQTVKAAERINVDIDFIIAGEEGVEAGLTLPDRPRGSLLTFEAEEEDGLEFVYWIVNGAIRENLGIIAKVFVQTDMHLISVYKPIGTIAVVFVDSNGKLLAHQALDQPGVPSLVGYQGLSKPGATPVGFFNKDGKTPAQTVEEDTVFFLEYETDKDGGTLTVDDVPLEKTYELNEIETLEGFAPENFSYWTDAEGNILSTDPNYKFTMLGFNRSIKSITNKTAPNKVVNMTVDLALREDYRTFVGQFEGRAVEFGFLISEEDVLIEQIDQDNVTIARSSVMNYETNEFVMSFPEEILSVRAYAIINDEVVLSGYSFVEEIDRTPEAEPVLYHWMPNSPLANITANIDLLGASEDDLTITLVEGNKTLAKVDDYDIEDGLLTVYGEFLYVNTNNLGTYTLKLETPYGFTTFQYYVVDNPEDTSIPTKVITTTNLGALEPVQITEPIAGAPDLMITEVGADTGDYNMYVEIFNNTDKQFNLKGAILQLVDTNAANNKSSIATYGGLFATPYGNKPFVINVDFILEPFETGIVWLINGGNRRPWNMGPANATGGHPGYHVVTEVPDANDYLLDYQGGNLSEAEFKSFQGIDSNVKIVVARDVGALGVNIYAHDENGFGAPLFAATAGFTSQNSSIANRAVQLLYFDPEIRHSPDAQKPANASYMKVDVSTFNPSRDMYTNGVLDLSKFIAFNHVDGSRTMIDVLFIRRIYYNSNDEIIKYDNGFNLGQWGVQTNSYYLTLAQTAIQSTALFYPPVSGSAAAGRWGGVPSKHGMQYTIPEPGEHLMRFLPRDNGANYTGFVNATYTDPVLNYVFQKGHAPYNADMFKIVVPVDPNYNYDYGTENTAGFVSNVNLGLD